MSGELLSSIQQTVGRFHPDTVWSTLDGQPRLVLTAAFFGLGVWLLVGELPGFRGRPSLLDQLGRQDVDRRLREALEAELSRTLGVNTEPDRGRGAERGLVPPILKRMARPLLQDLGWIARAVLLRCAPGLAGGASLERDLRLVRPGASVGGYFAEKVGAGILWLAIPPVLAALGGPQSPPAVWLAAGAVGFLLPDLDLRRRLQTRRCRILAELPAVLDQLVIATSAGLSLEQALDHTAAASDGTVADELRRVMTELAVGRWSSLHDALDGLDRRNDVPELSSVVGQLRAAHRQGVPVGQVLAAQADALRDRAKAQTVDAGGRATVRMVIPIAVFILPVLAVVVLVPAAVQLLQLGG